MRNVAARGMGALVAPAQRTFRMREFFRIFVWGMVAAVSLTIAIFAGSTEAGSDRARHAALQLREVIMPSGIKPARPLDAVEGRKLAETVRVLTADRERLLARIAALENNVDDMTGSIKRVERAARPVPTTIEQPFSPVAAMPPQPPARKAATDAGRGSAGASAARRFRTAAAIPRGRASLTSGCGRSHRQHRYRGRRRRLKPSRRKPRHRPTR